MANELYTITGQAQVLDASDVTNPVQAMQVNFRVEPSGVVGTITVPLADYSPQRVNTLITERANTINAVHDL